jgi:AraC family ethanolamine operon transcriptional activator
MISPQNHGSLPWHDAAGLVKATGSCQSLQFQDIDAFNQTLNFAGVTIIQLDPVPFHGEIIRINLDGMQVTHIKTNCRIYGHGGKSPEQLIFGTSLMPPDKHLIAHKTILPQPSLFGFDPTRDINLICPDHLQLAQILVSTARLQRHLQELERDDLDDRFFRQNSIQIVDTAYQNLTAYLHQLFHLATVNPQLVQRSQALITGDLLPLLVSCFTAEVSPRLRIQPFRRSDLVQQTEAFVMANLDQPQAICKAVKTSRRALCYGFQDIFGISPMTYLKLIRLNGVHRALKVSQPDSETILGIANRFGFWHMGHFSNAYKQMFGQSPSETLRSSKSGSS